MLCARWVPTSARYWYALLSCVLYCSSLIMLPIVSPPGCISSAAPINGSLNGFFDLSSRRAFRWSLTTSREGKIVEFGERNLPWFTTITLLCLTAVYTL